MLCLWTDGVGRTCVKWTRLRLTYTVCCIRIHRATLWELLSITGQYWSLLKCIRYWASHKLPNQMNTGAYWRASYIGRHINCLIGWILEPTDVHWASNCLIRRILEPTYVPHILGVPPTARSLLCVAWCWASRLSNQVAAVADFARVTYWAWHHLANLVDNGASGAATR